MNNQYNQNIKRVQWILNLFIENVYEYLKKPIWYKISENNKSWLGLEPMKIIALEHGMYYLEWKPVIPNLF